VRDKHNGCSLLEVRNLEVSYGKVRIFQDFSLRIDDGQICAIVGPNGSGKTTLVNSISGLKEVRSGTILFMGEDVTHLPPRDRVRRGIVQVSQNRDLFPNLTVLDNLLVGARYHYPRATVHDRLEWIFCLFPRLRERSRQSACTLSGGEQQMLSIARSLMLRPRLLLLDEPSASLAPILLRELGEIIRGLVKEGATVVVVEQNVAFALDLAGRVFVLRGGRLVFDGSPEQVPREQTEFFRRFYVD